MLDPKILTLDNEADGAGLGLETHYFIDASDTKDSSDFPSYLHKDGQFRLRSNKTLEGPEYYGQKSNKKETFGEDDREPKLLTDRMAEERHHNIDWDCVNIYGEELNSERDGKGPQAVQLEDEMEPLTKEYADLREEEDTVWWTWKNMGMKERANHRAAES